jgi:hypothetical protein
MNNEQPASTPNHIPKKESTNSYLDFTNIQNKRPSFGSFKIMDFPVPVDISNRRDTIRSYEYSMLLPESKDNDQNKLNVASQVRQRMSLFESFYLPFYNSRKSTEEEFKRNRLQLNEHEFVNSITDNELSDSDDSLSDKTNESNVTINRLKSEVNANTITTIKQTKRVFSIEKNKKKFGLRPESTTVEEDILHKGSTERTDNHLSQSKKDNSTYKKAQNRKAAQKCRLKKKQYYKALEMENTMLKDKLSAKFQVDEFTTLLKISNGQTIKLSDFDVSDEDMHQRSICIMVNLLLPDNLKNEEFYCISFDYDKLQTYIKLCQEKAAKEKNIDSKVKAEKVSFYKHILSLFSTANQIKVLSKNLS